MKNKKASFCKRRLFFVISKVEGMYMRFLSNTVFTTFLLFCSCHSPKGMLFQKHPPFVLEDVFYKSWLGGQPGVRGLVLRLSCFEQAEGLQLDFEDTTFQSIARLFCLRTRCTDDCDAQSNGQCKRLEKRLVVDL